MACGWFPSDFLPPPNIATYAVTMVYLYGVKTGRGDDRGNSMLYKADEITEGSGR